MGIFNLRDASVVYNSVNLSDHVRSVDVDMTAEDLDATAMGAVSRTHVPGLRDDSFTLNMFNDHAAGSVDATFAAQLGLAAGVVCVVKPTSAAVSATNPTYTCTVVLLDYHPLNGEVGNLSQTQIRLVAAQNSFIVRATS
jgi:hypothetical protein